MFDFTINKKKKQFITICETLIDSYELVDPSNLSCKDDLLKEVKHILDISHEEIKQWDRHEDLIHLGNMVLASTTFDLLATGQYNLRPGTLSPMKCGRNLLRVYDKCMEYALKNGDIDGDTKIEQRNLLWEQIRFYG